MVQKNELTYALTMGSKSKWLGLVAVLLLLYALTNTYKGFKAEVLHNELCKREQKILNYISVGNLAEANKLLITLSHPSEKEAPSISRDSIVTWKEYWEIRKKILEESMEYTEINNTNKP